MDAESVREDPIPGPPEAGLSGTTSRTRLRVDPARLQAYASWAEVVSAVAIVASLIYAGTELRRSTTMSNRDADVVLFERIADAQRMIIETPGLAEIIAVAGEAPAELSPADRLRYLTFQDHFLNSWEMGWHYRADGILDGGDWSEFQLHERRSSDVRYAAAEL